MKTMCSQCQAKFNTSDENKGKKATCPKCGKLFVISSLCDKEIGSRSANEVGTAGKDKTPLNKAEQTRQKKKLSSLGLSQVIGLIVALWLIAFCFLAVNQKVAVFLKTGMKPPLDWTDHVLIGTILPGLFLLFRCCLGRFGLFQGLSVFFGVWILQYVVPAAVITPMRYYGQALFIDRYTWFIHQPTAGTMLVLIIILFLLGWLGIALLRYGFKSKSARWKTSH